MVSRGMKYKVVKNDGSLVGDLMAATLTVAAGSRMRGQADFGWDDDKDAGRKSGNGVDRGGNA